MARRGRVHQARRVAQQLMQRPQGVVHVRRRSRGHLLVTRKQEAGALNGTRRGWHAAGRRLPRRSSTDLVGPAVESGHLGGALQEAAAALAQVLGHAGAEGADAAGEARLGVR